MKAGAISPRNLGLKGEAYYDVAIKWIKSWCHSIETEEEFNHSYRTFERWLASSEVQAEDALTARVAHLISNFVRKSMIPHSAKWVRSNFLYKRSFDRQSTQFVEAENSVMKRHPLGPKPQASLNVAAKAITKLNALRIDYKTKQAAAAMDQTQPGAIWPDMVTYCNKKVVGELLQEHAKIGNRVVAREGSLTYLVKSTSVISVNEAYDHDDFPNYIIPCYSRVRVVNVVNFQGSLYLMCSCGLFQRFGYPCADIYAVLSRPPQPSDAILRYHKEYSHFYGRDHSDKETNNLLLNKKFQEVFDTAIANEPPGPLYSDQGLPIAQTDQLANFKKMLPPATVVLRPESLEVDCNDSGNNSDDDMNIEDSSAPCKDKEDLLLSRRSAWLQNDFYKDSHSWYTEISKLADGSFKAYEIVKDGMSRLLEEARTAAAEGMRERQGVSSRIGSGAVSSCLELERSLKSKRKRPFGSPGRYIKK